MKIFFASCRYDHLDPKRGSSFEHENFYHALAGMPGVTVTEFPFEDVLVKGRREFNENLRAAAEREKPDLVFCFPYSDELEPATLAALKKQTTTLAWFADDSWRFYNYSQFWARHFSWAVTTYASMPERYRRAGQPNVIVSQWAADTVAYHPTAARGSGPDVSFVGAWTRPRARIIGYLAAHGIAVTTYGSGWPGGRLSQEDLLRVFSSSKINLALNPPPGFWNVNSLGRLVARASQNRIVPDFHVMANLQSWLHRGVPQVKARHFEIPACGGFMLTGPAADLERWYEPGKEIAIYADLPDLAQKIRHYLAHPAEREAMAQAAYERTLREHTYAKRFAEIFRAMGLAPIKNS